MKDRLIGKQVARGQQALDDALAKLSESELSAMLDASQFDGARQLDPSRAPAIDSFLERVARRDFAALAADLERGIVDASSWFYAPGWTGPRPFDYGRHYAAVCAELARRARG